MLTSKRYGGRFADLFLCELIGLYYFQLTNDFLESKRPVDKHGAIVLKRTNSNSSISSGDSEVDRLEDLMQPEYNWDGCDKMERMYFRFWDTFKNRHQSIADIISSL